MDSFFGLLALLFMIAIAVLAYFIPFIIALLKKKNNTVAIFFLNLLVGWTFLGWVAAFIWSLTKDDRTA
ncbi:superinfection immunity protein [Metabacillus fastidiosus]|uniref:Superinfection immunity protein n=1 Tax=Metabacillus fastidiosus TaxID=1458 RepID=A0ABU6P121_9BACI|nr:superinfection immunity protein [Metabacillus fastidiosus]MEC2076674.1 superinfection immunity protein [Metabacillus fastidiosus]MED4402688.1 superinfection immunity protein [Metabacillus fastidiosus]MED4454858.1 superinfection immunity protein [Metabacillus fastidiosus]MED4462046.1 superinfection immunity protein [Metabacillus fastidiosus]